MRKNKHYQISKSEAKRNLFGVVILGSAIFLYFKWEDAKIVGRYNYLKENGTQHYAKIENLRGRTKCLYEVDGRMLDLIVRTPFKGLMNGEMYLMAYNAERPIDGIVFFDKPFITDSSAFLITPMHSGYLKKCSNRKYYFKYIVDRITYERVQLIDADKTIPSKVFYKESNPSIAYLYYENE